jgi:hypothetical protein
VKRANVSKLLVLALVVVVIAVAFVVPMVGGAVAVGPPTVGGDGSTAIECQSGHACGGAPLALKCQSGTACGGIIVARVAKNAECQSGTSCGG